MLKHLRKLDLDNFIKWGVAAIILAVPLYPKFPFLRIPGIYVAIRLEDFLILVVTIMWGLKVLPKLKELWKNEIVRAIAIFLAVGLVSTISAALLTHTVTWYLSVLEWGRRVEYLVGFFVALTQLKKKEDLVFYVKCIGVVLAVVFLFGVGQKYFGLPVITTQNEEYSKGIALRYVPGGHLASTFAGHYDLATYIILTTPILVALFFMEGKKWSEFLGNDIKKGKFVLGAIIIVSFWLMVNAASRISAVSYVLSVSTTLFLLKKYKYIPVIAIITFIFVLLTSNLLTRYQSILDVLRKKISLVPVAYAQSVATPVPMPVVQDLSTSIRLNVEWPRAVRAFEKNPLLGTGYSSISLATDNDYLRALGEIGILGVISTFFVFFRIGKTFVKEIPLGKEINFRNAYLAGMMGAIPGVILNGFFIDVFEASKFAIAFWMFVGFGIALIYNRVGKE